jgi:hypothetical protein
VHKSDVLDFGQFSGWFDFKDFVTAKQAGRTEWAQVAPPRSPGVYVFATSSASRARGNSDIFYIGKADNLRDRIGKYLYRVKRSAERDTKEAAIAMEAWLLAAYRSEHGQLPPNNRIGGAML